jgi:tRNA wybutosine-synthesizing protein 1
MEPNSLKYLRTKKYCMLTKEAREELEKQQYRIVGEHSAVKICGWTKQMIRGHGSCYKHKFYGIRSSQCLQMSTSLSCANRCVFCWRGYKAPVSKEWCWHTDSPEMIFEGSLKAQKGLLAGFGGSENADKKEVENSKTVRHVALSLTGEPIIYPKLNELIDLFHKNKISTFLVTNAQYPTQIKKMHSITQLYLSLDAPNKKLLEEVDKPLFGDYWARLQKSLNYLKERKERTCIRLTMMRGINMTEPENYALLIKKGDPDFVEVKAYMFVGESRERLKKENMPTHQEVKKFAKELLKHLKGYDYVSQHIPSRVVLLAKKKFKKNGKWNTWIGFEKFFELVQKEKQVSSLKYSEPVPVKDVSKPKKKVRLKDEMELD